LIDDLREQVPGIALRTTLLTGHPGEMDSDFEELVEFVEKTKFERLGIFTYSHEEDTYAATKYKDSIPSKLKMFRANTIMEIQQKISAEKNEAKVGLAYKTIIDKKEGDYFIGRTEYDSPEVDNEVLIHSNKQLKTGEFYSVKIKETNEFDLIGEID